MDSRCYGCAAKFTLFKKECGCKNCGRAFCSGCLSFSAAVPRAGNTQHKVCKQCHEVLTRGSTSASTSKWSPPQNYKKRMAALEAKQKPGTPRSQGLTQQDQVIAERLARLRQENKPKMVASQAEIEARLAALRDDPQRSIPSTQEMEARLATLQGRAPPSQTPQLVHQTPDTRTHIQQAQDLLTQLAAEVAIDESLERRGPVTLQDYRLPDSDDDEDEETAIQRVMQQLTEEAALDEASGFNIPAEPASQPQAQPHKAEPEAPKPETEIEELPWCCICNEDASLRCTGCDGDLYCARCFREGHDAFELKEHQTSAYHPPRASREH
ncbi:PREDICTED: zinc finger FYVE domain-containing protein 19 isoform X2 [Elephantulus edwardii]|uniref:zinc finger FYVE domain-containing protein 19 isoform X2 n=1 Tax=Elephantulus edwardii TaxID=28737 RepID=UPI0003F0E904|nr:PREDICTED: zinc finger FYVE domain-containing protein 19 isoform X2 [Elephantulus edwardii]